MNDSDLLLLLFGAVILFLLYLAFLMQRTCTILREEVEKMNEKIETNTTKLESLAHHFEPS
jgi:cell division protein FtsL